MARLFANGLTSVSVGGQEYKAAADGSFEVPEEGVAALLELGLSRAPIGGDAPAPCAACAAKDAKANQLEDEFGKAVDEFERLQKLAADRADQVADLQSQIEQLTAPPAPAAPAQPDDAPPAPSKRKGR